MSVTGQYSKLFISFGRTMGKLRPTHFDYGMPPDRPTKLQARSPLNEMHHSCLTKSSPVIKRLFSYFRLFTLSAYSEPQFWARSLLAFLLCWSGYASQEFADVILQSSEGKSKADDGRVFCLPSRGMVSSMAPSLQCEGTDLKNM